MRRLLLFAGVFFCSLATAQVKTLYLNEYTPDEGLTERYITSVIRDRYGFIWTGTRDGLFRFDGYRFSRIGDQKALQGTIPTSYITSLEITADSLLVYGTSSAGFGIYDFKKDTLMHKSPAVSGLVSAAVNVIRYDDGDHSILIGQNNGGLTRYYLSTGKHRKLHTSMSLFDIRKINKVWYASGISHGVRSLDRLDVKRTMSPYYSYASTVNTIFQDREGQVWCGAWDNGLHLFHNEERLQTWFFDGKDTLGLSGDEILSITQDERGILWLGTKLNGILFFDPVKKEFIDAYRFSTKVDGRVNTLYRDNRNRIWIGTSTGLFMYDPLLNQFDTYVLKDGPQEKPCQINQRLVTPGGLDILISNCGLYYRYPADKEYRFKTIRDGGVDMQLTAIYRTSNGVIYLGTNKSLYKLDTLKLEISKIAHVSPKDEARFRSLNATRVNRIIPMSANSDSLLLFSVYGHELFLLSANSDRVVSLGYWKSPSGGTPIENLTRNIFRDSKDQLYICGASTGIQKLNFLPDFSFESRYKVSYSNRDSVYRWQTYAQSDVGAVKEVYDMREAGGAYWVSTVGNGLLRFNPDNIKQPFTQIPVPVRSVMGMATVKDSVLWMIISGGVASYNVRSGKFRYYNSTHGLTPTISGYFSAGSDGKLNAGFDHGFISFHPDSIITENEIPSLHISQCWVMDQDYRIPSSQRIDLGYRNNFVKFNLSSNIFSFQEQVKYLYRMTGLDADWRDNGNNPLIVYTSIPPGTYQLECMAITATGEKSLPYVLTIEVHPPFYATWWFIVSCALLVVIIAWLVYRYRLNQILKLQEVRANISRDLHDDIGSTLGSIHLYSQLAKHKGGIENEEGVKDILEKIESGSKEIMEKTADTVWFVNTSSDTFGNLLARMHSHATAVLPAFGIDVSVETDPQLDKLRLGMMEKKNFFLIFKEAIFNITRYAKASNVTVTTIRKGRRVILRIHDNGEGFDPVTAVQQPKGGGNGLKNLRKRAEEAGAELEISSAPGKGTTIELTFSP